MSKYPNMKYVPQIITTIPNADTIDTPCLDMLDPECMGFDVQVQESWPSESEGIELRSFYRHKFTCM